MNNWRETIFHQICMPRRVARRSASAIGVVLLLLLGRRLWRARRDLTAVRHEGERLAEQQAERAPLLAFMRDKRPGDPLNVRLIGTKEDISTAFAAAGWRSPDKTTLATSIRICVACVFGLPYATAPVSSLYLYGRPEDLIFECPGRTARERTHARFWETGATAGDGRPTWIGCVARDAGIEISAITLLPTHRVAPDIDAARSQLVEDLTAAGWVVELAMKPGFGEPVRGRNGHGDVYSTDGQIVELILAAAPLAHKRRPAVQRSAQLP